MQMVMTPDETQIQIFANWPMSHATTLTGDNRKNPEYRVIAAVRISNLVDLSFECLSFSNTENNRTFSQSSHVSAIAYVIDNFRSPLMGS